MSADPRATPVSAPVPVAPVGQGERIGSIDVLRGVALLGILPVNMQMFAMVTAAYTNPTAYGDLAGLNLLTWIVTHVFFDQKFMTIFSPLFGAGIVLMADRAIARGKSAAWLHYRRTFWLLLIGLVHAYLIWAGDILVLYSICGAVAFLFRRLGPRWLIGLGIASLAVSSGISLFAGLTMPFWPEQEMAAFAADWKPTQAEMEIELEAYRGSWSDQNVPRWKFAHMFHTEILFFWGFWRAGGLMLIGMALFKLGVFSASRSVGFYRRMAAVGFGVGLPVVVLGAWLNFRNDWSVEYSFFQGGQFNYWGSLFVSAGYVGVVMLACLGSWLPGLQRRFAAVGQTALSCYLMHSLICTTLYYGHGFGLFGSVPRIGQFGVAVGIWILQLILAPWWLGRFRFGPFEWAWRSLTYFRPQPLRR